MTEWCVLQMTGNRTLPVVRSLRRAGFDVWAPKQMRRQTRPRSRQYRDVEVPIMTGYAFARAHHLPELFVISASPMSDHPRFWLPVRPDAAGGSPDWDHFPRFPDSELECLRDYEAAQGKAWEEFVAQEEAAELERRRKKRTVKRKRGKKRAYVLGQRVNIVDPAWSGLDAQVTVIKPNGSLEVTVGDGLFKLVLEACDLTPIQLDIRAKAA